MEEVVTDENRTQALEAVKRNKGAAGIDRMTTRELENHLQAHWEKIRAKLLTGTYVPSPVRRVEIPKRSGGTRMLGIPTVQDRFIQQMLLQGLTPIFEPMFSESSYGFRPGRSAQDAVRAAQKYAQEGKDWVVDIDITKFFDHVHHDILMGRVGREIRDKRVLQLIGKFLRRGAMVEGIVEASVEGTPQGGPLSPLLANIYLDALDKELDRRGHAYCRYADDFVVVVKGTRAHAHAVRQTCRTFLEDKLKLTLNMEKTHITHVNDGFVFLGHRIIRKRGPRGRLRPVSTIPWKKYRGFARTLVRELSGNYSVNKIDLVERLNRKLSGWANFYQYTDFTATPFSRLDRIVFWKFGHWLARKHRAPFTKLMRDGVRAPEPGRAKTWYVRGRTSRGRFCELALRRLVTSRKGQFRWRTPEGNPYLLRDAKRKYIESRYADVAFALSNT